MATPHVAGAVCLMLSKSPGLSPAVVDSILEITAVDRGPAGKDNDYGAGRIDVLAAVNYIVGQGGPMLNLQAKVVQDSTPGGNGDGKLDPGESAKLLMTLRNTGGSACNNTQGTLKSGDARLTVTDNHGTWGNIASGGSADNNSDKFAVTAGSGIPPGTVVACTLNVTGDSADYAKAIVFTLTVGTPPRQPGEIIWGPKTCPSMPTQWGLYGLAYNSSDNYIYCNYYMSATIYKYSSDSLLSYIGTIPAPEDSCTDLDYASDGNFWLVANPSKKVYKITPTGTVLRSFSLPFTSYPLGIAEEPTSHQLYISDRRQPGELPAYIFVTDTLGNVLDTITHPMNGGVGPRCLSLDPRSPVNTPSLLNMYTWFDASGTTLDSCVMYELNRVTGAVLHSFMFTNTGWNMRGIENDPRDGSYWVTIMQGGTTDNQIAKVTGFNYGTGVEEPGFLPRGSGAVRADVRPNPFFGTTLLSLELARPGSVDLRVFDNTGRLVRTIASGLPVQNRAQLAWNGTDDAGRAVVPGIYFFRASASGEETWGKLVLTR